MSATWHLSCGARAAARHLADGLGLARAVAGARPLRARPEHRPALQPVRPRRRAAGGDRAPFWAGFASANRSERRAWLLIGTGVAAWTFGELYYTAVLWTAAEIPIPSPADAGYLLFPPLMLLGVLALLRSRTRNVPDTLWADGIIAALAVSAASAALVFQTVQESASGQGLEVAVNLAYPLTDLVLLGVIVGALAGTGWQLDRTWMLLFAGIGTFWLADSLYLVGNANGHVRLGLVVRRRLVAGPLPDRRAPPGSRSGRQSSSPPSERLRRIVAPLCFGAAGLSLLVYASLSERQPHSVAPRRSVARRGDGAHDAHLPRQRA